MAAIKMSSGDEAEKKRSISALKVQVGKSGRFVGQNAIQLHGGMGMTDELNIGQYFKRLTAIETLFGNVDHHLKKYSIENLCFWRQVERHSRILVIRISWAF